MHHRSSCQISSKSVKPLRGFRHFSISQDGGRRHLGFLKLYYYWQLRSGGSTCITVPNLVKIGQTVFEIRQFFKYFFPDGGWHHLRFQKFSNFIS